MSAYTDGLRERRDKAVGIMLDISTTATTEHRSVTKEETERFKKAEAEQIRLDKEIEMHVKTEQLQEQRNREREQSQSEKRTAERQAKEKKKSVADYDAKEARARYERFFRSSKHSLSKEDREYLHKGMQLGPEYRKALGADPERRAAVGGQNIGVDADGGILAPDNIGTEMLREVAGNAPLLDNVRVMFTSNGNLLPFYTNDASQEMADYIDELDGAAINKVSFGRITMNAHKITSGVVPISNEAIQDTINDIIGEVRWVMGERFGNRLNRDFVLGTNNKAQGMLSNAGHQVAGNAALSFADFIKLEGAVPNKYKAGAAAARSKYVLHENSVTDLKIAALAQGNDFFWAPSMRDGTPNLINGYAYVTNSYMPVYGAGNSPLLFGDLGQFRVRIVRNMAIKRLDELYATNDAVGFVGFMRFDSKVLRTGAFARLDIAA